MAATKLAPKATRTRVHGHIIPRNYPGNADLNRVIAAAQALAAELRAYLDEHPEDECRCGRCRDSSTYVSDIAAAVRFQADICASLFECVVWPGLDD